MSVSLYIGDPSLDAKIISSTTGLWKSILSEILFFINPKSTDFLISDFNSLILPIQISSLPSLVLHIGSGVPQNLDLLKFQSTRFSSQLPKRPVPVDSGCQLMSLFLLIKSSLSLVEFINQDSRG